MVFEMTKMSFFRWEEIFISKFLYWGVDKKYHSFDEEWILTEKFRDFYKNVEIGIWELKISFFRWGDVSTFDER